MRDTAEAWQEIVFRVFGINTELQGKTAVGNIFLAITERQASGNAQLLTHNIHPGDLLGNGVLDLNTGIHFHEVHFIAGQQEFDRTGIFITNGCGRFHRQPTNILALLRC